MQSGLASLAVTFLRNMKDLLNSLAKPLGSRCVPGRLTDLLRGKERLRIFPYSGYLPERVVACNKVTVFHKNLFEIRSSSIRSRYERQNCF